MIDFKIVREIHRNKWSEFVYNHPYGNVFQTPEMFDVFKATKNYEPVFFAVIDDNHNLYGTLLAVIQKQYSCFLGNFTARSIIWGGPLVKDSDSEIIKLILREYDKIISHKAVYSQFRNFWDQKRQKDVFGNYGFEYEEHLNILIDLTKSEDQLWKEVHSNRRNKIRNAEKKGTTYREIKNKNDIEESYNILENIYNRIKLPLPDKSIFDASENILLDKNMINFFGAINNNRIIGTRIVLCFKDTIHAWYAGSYKEYYNKHPNDLLAWKVFLWGKKSGYKTFDFGGAGKPNKPYGVRDYKEKFGGRLVEYGRFNKVHKPLEFKLSKAAFKLWQKIKR